MKSNNIVIEFDLRYNEGPIAKKYSKKEQRNPLSICKFYLYIDEEANYVEDTDTRIETNFREQIEFVQILYNNLHVKLTSNDCFIESARPVVRFKLIEEVDVDQFLMAVRGSSIHIQAKSQMKLDEAMYLEDWKGNSRIYTEKITDDAFCYGETHFTAEQMVNGIILVYSETGYLVGPGK